MERIGAFGRLGRQGRLVSILQYVCMVCMYGMYVSILTKNKASAGLTYIDNLVVLVALRI